MNKLEYKDKQAALHIARKSVEFYTKYKKRPSRERFLSMASSLMPLETGVDVTIWVNGNLRGSTIIEKCHLIDGIIDAAISSANDSRFKTILTDEIQHARLEITILLDSKRFQNIEDVTKNEIQSNKGYKIYQKNKRGTGWYLPLVFNIKKFKDTEKFISSLAEEKLFVDLEPLKKHLFEIEIFEVIDFIESSDNKDLVLDIENTMIKSLSLSAKKILEKSHIAASRLINNQESDGNIPPIINIFTGKNKQFDRTRLAFSAYALAKFGKITKNNDYYQASKNSFDYLKSQFESPITKNQFSCLDLAYFGKLALILNEQAMARECAKTLLIESWPSILDPISLQHISDFFCKMSPSESTFLNLSETHARFAWSHFKKDTRRPKPVELAIHSELVNTNFKLYEITCNEKYFSAAKEVAEWLLKYQLEDGSFRISSGTHHANTRPTGKIIEVLALLVNHPKLNNFERNRYHRAIKKGLDWMFSMQYDKENTYFIEPHIRSKIIGGFRHTYFDPDTWIDSIGHLLLAMSRLDLEHNPHILDYQEPPNIVYPLYNNQESGLKYSSRKTNFPLFFGKVFYWDQKIHKLLDKSLSILKRFNQFKPESILENSNDILRNYSYVFEYMAEEKIIEKINIKNLLKYTRIEKFPGFYESFLRAKNNKNCFGRGFGKDWEKTLGQCIGEFFERYGHIQKEKKELIKASISDIKKHICLKLDSNSFFSEEQKEKYPNRKWDNESPFFWQKCLRYSDKKEILIPSQLIYFGHNKKNEPFLQESNTSGLGGWFTEEGAVLSALYEIIQRDAYFYHWLNKITPPRIDLETIKDKEIKKSIRQAHAAGIDFVIIDLTTNTKIPSIATIIIDKSGQGPLYSLGAGCNPDCQKALKRSYEEAWSIYYNLRLNSGGIYDEELPKNYQPFITPINIDRRLKIWANQKMRGKLDFFLNGSKKSISEIASDYPKYFPDEKNELDFAVRNIRQLGQDFEVYVHISKDKFLKKVNYQSARVFVPGLIPMYYNEENTPANHPRIIDKNNINTLLHLFP